MPDDNNDDDISITSTVSSEGLYEYDVEHILAEREFDGVVMYLVKWLKYPIERCTWEPADSFTSEDTLLDWRKKKHAISEGRRQPFDVERWEYHMAAIAAQKDEKKRRRAAKRARLRRIALADVESPSEKDGTAGRAHGNKTPASRADVPDASKNRTPSGQANPETSQSVPSRKPAAVSFRMKPPAPDSARVKKPLNNEPNKWWNNLSTKWKHEKASREEPAPNVDQLELMRPSEWTSRPSASVSKLGPHKVLPSRDAEQNPPEPAKDSKHHKEGSDSRAAQPSNAPLEERITSNDTFVNNQQVPVPNSAPAIPQKERAGRNKSVISRFGERFWNKGEVLVTMYYGPDKEEIGPARLCGLDLETRKRVLFGKRDHEIEVWFQYTCTVDEYAILNQGTPGIKFCNGWIEGFPDTDPEICLIGNRLHRSNMMAICYPQYKGQSIMLAYSPLSADFGFLNAGFSGPPRTPIYLAARSPLGPIERITLPLRRNVRQTKTFQVDSRTFNSPTPISSNQKDPATSTPQRRSESTSSRAPRDRDGYFVPCPTSTSGGKENNPQVEQATRETAQRRFQSQASHQISPGGAKPDNDREDLSDRMSISDVNGQDENDDPLNMISTSQSHPVPSQFSLTSPAPSQAAHSRPPHSGIPGSLPSQAADRYSVQNSAPENVTTQNTLPQATQLPTASPTTFSPPATFPSNLEVFDLNQFFEKHFGITFKRLASLQGTSGSYLCKSFYLMFPKEPEIVQKEYELLKNFLESNDVLLFSSYVPRDWEKFVLVKPGVVVFHETFNEYHTMHTIRDLMSKPFSFWSISLTAPLQQMRNQTHLQRLFPNGGVILMTEDFMTRDPRDALVVLAWFKDLVSQKFPGSWKMMFRPNILDWLLKQLESTDTSQQALWLDIYALIMQLSYNHDKTESQILSGSNDEYSESHVISPPFIPNYGSRTEGEYPDAPKDQVATCRNADHLVEFFTGWSLLHAHLYRKFIVATSLGRFIQRWNEWHHVEVCYGAKHFMNTVGIEHKYYWNLVRGKPLPRDHKAQSMSSTPQTPKPSALPGEGDQSTTSRRSSYVLTQGQSATNDDSQKHQYPQPYT